MRESVVVCATRFLQAARHGVRKSATLLVTRPLAGHVVRPAEFLVIQLGTQPRPILAEILVRGTLLVELVHPRMQRIAVKSGSNKKPPAGAEPVDPRRPQRCQEGDRMRF